MDIAEVTALLEKQGKAWEDFKEFNDKREAEAKEHGEALAQTVEKLDKANTRLDQLEKEIAKANRPEILDGKQGRSDESKAHFEAFESFIRNDKAGMTPEQVKIMLVSNDTGGGFLAPEELVLEIDKDIVEISNIRQHARVRTTTMRSIRAPVRTGTPKAVFVGEGKAPATSESKYGQDQIHTFIEAATVEVTDEDLEDSGFDLEAEIRSDVSEQFAFAEGEAFVIGNGVNKPEGFTTDTSITSTDTTNSLAISEANDLIDMQFRLKSAYWPNLTWFMNRTYIGVVRKLKDSDGQYLWQPGLNGPTQMMLLGFPIAEIPDMKNTTSPLAGDIVVALGDWRRGYWIVDRKQMAVVRDDLTKADQGVIRLIFRKRIGGQTRRREAIDFLKLKA